MIFVFSQWARKLLRPNSSKKKKKKKKKNKGKNTSVILRCEEYINWFEDDIPSPATTNSFEKFFQANQGNDSKGSKTSSALSKHSIRSKS